MRTLLWLLPLLGLAAGCSLFGPRIPDAVTPELVLVDSSEPAFTVFTAAPLDLSRAEVEELYAHAEQNAGAELMAWQSFLNQRDDIFDACVVRNEYPGSQVRTGLVELLERYPATPFGVSWSGGVALTLEDYRYAQKTYELHVADPSALGRDGGTGAYQDPLVPMLHFGPLLGWE